MVKAPLWYVVLTYHLGHTLQCVRSSKASDSDALGHVGSTRLDPGLAYEKYVTLTLVLFPDPKHLLHIMVKLHMYAYCSIWPVQVLSVEPHQSFEVIPNQSGLNSEHCQCDFKGNKQMKFCWITGTTLITPN